MAGMTLAEARAIKERFAAKNGKGSAVIVTMRVGHHGRIRVVRCYPKNKIDGMFEIIDHAQADRVLPKYT